MAVTFSTNPNVKEESGTLKENSDVNSGLTASVTLRVPFADRYTVMQEILGSLQLYPYKTNSGARARTATCIPHGGSDTDGQQGLVYDHALLTINYTQFSGAGGASPGGTVYSESLEPNAEFLTLDHSKFRWGSGDGDELEPNEAPGFLIYGLDLVQTRYNLTNIPGAVLTEIGKCNSSAKTAALLGLTFPPETIMFAGGSPSRSFDASGNAKWTLPCRFSFRSNGWNRVWRAKTQSWERIYIAEGGQYNNYPLSALSGLLV